MNQPPKLHSLPLSLIQPNPPLIALLKDLLQLAEEGKIQSLMAQYLEGSEPSSASIIRDDLKEHLLFVGMLTVENQALGHEVLHYMTDSVSPEDL